MRGQFPTVSVVTPTLNSQRTLTECLLSVSSQDYPGKVEIIIADGGSKDDTLDIAQKFDAKIVKNLLQTGEAGKAVGAKAASGEILAFVDSDNVLPDKLWLRKMVAPFLTDKEIVATEPLFFTYREKDHWLTRYFALLGMGDPLNLFIGNYDRYSFISGKWTRLKIKTVNKKDYLVLYLKREMPTIGANGFLVRKKELEKYPIKEYLFDIDVLKFLSKQKSIKVAKVKTGIVHLFSGNVSTFVRKQRRRIRDFLYFTNQGLRAEEDNKGKVFWGVVKFTLLTLAILPLFWQAVRGYFRRRDWVWFFHPLACWITLLAYSFEFVRSLFVRGQFERKTWSQ